MTDITETKDLVFQELLARFRESEINQSHVTRVVEEEIEEDVVAFRNRYEEAS